MSDELGGRYFREARFFLAGDKTAASSHIPEARVLMGYMRDQLNMGGPAIQVQYATLDDGTVIRATMMNGQFQAQIESPGGRPVPIEQDYWPIVVVSTVDSLKRVAKNTEGCGVVAKPETDPVFGPRYWYGKNTVIFTTAVYPLDIGDLWLRRGSTPASMIGTGEVIGSVVGFTEYEGQVFVVKVTSEEIVDAGTTIRYTYKLYTLIDNVLDLVHTCAAVDMPVNLGAALSVDVTFNETGNTGLAVGNLPVDPVNINAFEQQLLQITISGDKFSGFTYADTRLTALSGFPFGTVSSLVSSRIAATSIIKQCYRYVSVVGFRVDVPVMLIYEWFAETGSVDGNPYMWFRDDRTIFEVVGGAVGSQISFATKTYYLSLPDTTWVERIWDYTYVMAADLRVGAYTYIRQSGTTFSGNVVTSATVHITYSIMGTEYDVYSANRSSDPVLDTRPLERTPHYSPTAMEIARIQSVPHVYSSGVMSVHPAPLVFSPHDVGSSVWSFFTNTSSVKLLCSDDIVDVTAILTNGTGNSGSTRYSAFGIR